jgi:hypothetical protein
VQSCKGLREYKTAELCIKADVPTLGAMVRETDSETMEIILAKFINKLQNDLNPKRKMETEQVLECAMLIIDDFKQLNMADVHLIFTNAKKGKYGELYESINMAKVYSWFEVYFKMRCETAAILSQRESQSYKSPGKRTGETSLRDKIRNG